MECSCIDVDVSDSAVTSLADKIVVARRDHKCSECGVAIAKGSRYRNEAYICEGDLEHHKTCLTCNSVRDDMFCSFYYGMIWETLNDEIIEMDGDLPQKQIAALIPEAREKVCDLIEAYWERT